LKYPRERDYTSHNTQWKVKTRIDRIYVNKTLSDANIQISHVINAFSDHRAITATFKMPTNIGPGYWKCNTSVLDDKDLKQDLEAFWDKQIKRTKDGKINLEWCENCKAKINEIILWHSKRLAKNRRDHLNNLDSEIQKLKEFYKSEDGEDNLIISQLIAEKKMPI
jgi:hypothetical protein